MFFFVYFVAVVVHLFAYFFFSGRFFSRKPGYFESGKFRASLSFPMYFSWEMVLLRRRNPVTRLFWRILLGLTVLIFFSPSLLVFTSTLSKQKSFLSLIFYLRFLYFTFVFNQSWVMYMRLIIPLFDFAFINATWGTSWKGIT